MTQASAAYEPTRLMAPGSRYGAHRADYADAFIQALKHTKGRWSGQALRLIDRQEQIIRDLFGVVKIDGYRQFATAYVKIQKKQGKSELAAAVVSWFRRITEEHRLVYLVDGEDLVVLQARFHDS